MNWTKKQKQWMVGAGVAVVLLGGGVALTMNHQAQVRADKIAQEEKAAYDKLVKAAQEATKKAETFKAEADVKSAQDAFKKLEEKDKTALNARVEKVRQNWDLVNKAEKNVVNAEKAKTDATVKTAQTAINQLKAEMTKAKKTALQKRLDKVKAEIKAKKDKATAEKKAQEAAAQQKAQEAQTATQNNTQAQAAVQNNVAQTSSGNDSAPQTEASAQSPAYNGYAQAPAEPAPSAQAPQTGSVGQATAPTQSQQAQPSTGNPAYNSGGGIIDNFNGGHASMDQIDKYTENANNNINNGCANGGR